MPWGMTYGMEYDKDKDRISNHKEKKEDDIVVFWVEVSYMDSTAEIIKLNNIDGITDSAYAIRHVLKKLPYAKHNKVIGAKITYIGKHY